MGSAGENQLNVVRTAEVEVLAQNFFEEHTAVKRVVEDLGRGEPLNLRESLAVIPSVSWPATEQAISTPNAIHYVPVPLTLLCRPS